MELFRVVCTYNMISSIKMSLTATLHKISKIGNFIQKLTFDSKTAQS